VDGLQTEDFPHHLQYGGLRNTSGTDAIRLAVSKARRDLANGNQVTMLGKDVVSAFNHLHKEGTHQSLREAGVAWNAINYVTRFPSPRSSDISWHSTKRARAHMDQGTLQGSPLTPSLWLAYLARTLKARD